MPVSKNESMIFLRRFNLACFVIFHQNETNLYIIDSFRKYPLAELEALCFSLRLIPRHFFFMTNTFCSQSLAEKERLFKIFCEHVQFIPVYTMAGATSGAPDFTPRFLVGVVLIDL